MAECLIHVHGGVGRMSKDGKRPMVKGLCGRWVYSDIIVGDPECNEVKATCPRCEKRASVPADPAREFVTAIATVVEEAVNNGEVEVTRLHDAEAVKPKRTRKPKVAPPAKAEKKAKGKKASPALALTPEGGA